MATIKPVADIAQAIWQAAHERGDPQLAIRR
jgi:hypothetical protein